MKDMTKVGLNSLVQADGSPLPIDHTAMPRMYDALIKPQAETIQIGPVHSTTDEKIPVKDPVMYGE